MIQTLCVTNSASATGGFSSWLLGGLDPLEKMTSRNFAFFFDFNSIT